MKKFSNEVLEELRGTGDYNQMRQKIKKIIEDASGYFPMTAAVKVAPWLYVEVMPTFTGEFETEQTGWQLIFVRCDKNGVFRFYNTKTTIYSTWVRKKDGKAKAATKFTDEVFLYLFENGSVCL